MRCSAIRRPRRRSSTLLLLIAFALPAAADAPEGWPAPLWRTCWKDGRLDITGAKWQALPAARQSALAAAYQRYYAAKIGKPVERTHGPAKIPLRLIPPVKLWIGSPAGEVRRYAHERRRAVVVSAFWLAKTELTQAQWKTLMGSVPSYFQPSKPRTPVDAVSFQRARAFCKKTGMRMPTEAEWEHACRSGSTRRFPWGAAWDAKRINSASSGTGKDLFTYEAWAAYDMPRALQRLKVDDQLKKVRLGTLPVGSFAANAFGLHDTLGNLWEWCSDRFAPDQPGHVIRGGSWTDPASLSCRCASRHTVPDGDGSFCLGLRPAMSLEK